MSSKLDEKALEELAAAELLNEAKRGREREKTLGTAGWKKPTSRPNKIFIGRSVASALRQTKYQDEAKSKKKPKSYHKISNTVSHSTTSTKDHSKSRKRDLEQNLSEKRISMPDKSKTAKIRILRIMSFDSYREFETSLQAARERRKKPNVNKKVLAKFILSTEAHNRNQEEQEMWMRRFASKNEQRESSSSDEHKKTKHKKSKNKKKLDRKRKRNHDDQSSCSDPDVGPDVEGYLKSKNLKWGHDGYRELYGEADSPKLKTAFENEVFHDYTSYKRNASSKICSSEDRPSEISKMRRQFSHESSSSEDIVSKRDSNKRKSKKKTKKAKRKKEKFEWVEK